MTLGIEATFLLGTFTGHRSDGTPDPLPDPARLHAALLNAAAQGSTAVAGTEGLEPSPDARDALEWLDANPPTGLRLPRLCSVATSSITAYRREGVITKENAAWTDKIGSRPLSDGVAMGGPIGWCWDQEVPEGMRSTLEALCADVSCLGEATSPVRLVVADVEPTHTLDLDGSMFDAGGTEVRVPIAGRTKALIGAHNAANLRPPSLIADQHKTTEKPSPPKPTSHGIEFRRYRAPEVAGSPVPWSTVVLLATSLSAAPEHRVRWCTALHRALIARVGFGAPPLITGVYPKGVRQPTNRLAIQYLPATMVGQHHLASAAFALLIPSDAAAADLASLHRALTGFRGFSAAGARAEVADIVAVRGDEFWEPPLLGYRRRWATNPVAVPETLPQRRGSANAHARPRWTLGDAARLSVGLVWRDAIAPPRTSSRWFEQIAARTAEVGVEVHDVRLWHKSDAARWVHKTPKELLVQPYRATLSLGTLATDRTIVAIGQSRHLGGGLLVPVDSPADTLAMDQERGR